MNMLKRCLFLTVIVTWSEMQVLPDIIFMRLLFMSSFMDFRFKSVVNGMLVIMNGLDIMLIIESMIKLFMFVMVSFIFMYVMMLIIWLVMVEVIFIVP